MSLALSLLSRGRASLGGRARGRFRQALFLAVLLFLLARATGHPLQSVGWDDAYYLAETSSLVEDGDLDLRNDVLHLNVPPLELLRILTATLGDGTLKNTFGVGPAVFWLPAYVAGLPAGSGRWNTVQRAALHLESLALTLLVVWFLARWLRGCGTRRRLAAWAALALLVASPLLIYGLRQYTMSHLVSAAAACWLVAAAVRLDREARPFPAFLCGIALGLVVLARFQGATLSLILVVPLLRCWQDPERRRRLPAILAGLAAGFLPVALLQLHAWAVERGVWLTMPQGGGYMRWTHPELFRFLFSGRCGLFPWSPIFLLGIVGLCLPWRARVARPWAWAALAILCLDIYVNAAVSDWWGGASYGARRMSADLPLVALGIANLSRTRWRRFLPAALAVLSLYGLWTATLYRRDVQDLSLVFFGVPSDAPGAERETVVIDPAAARSAARASPLPFHGFDYFADLDRRSSSGGRILTTGLMLGCLIFMAWLLAAFAPRRLLAATLLAAAALCALAHLRILTGPGAERSERARWQERVFALEPRPARQPETAPPGNLQAPGSVPPRLADAYAYLEVYALFAAGEGARARETLEPLSRAYPAPQQLWAQTGSGLLQMLPGTFLSPNEQFKSGRYLEVSNSVPDAPRLLVEFELALGGLTPGCRQPLLLLDQPSGLLARIALAGGGGTVMETPTETVRAADPWLAGGHYRVALSWNRRNGTVNLEAKAPGEEGRSLLARLPAVIQPETRLGLRFGGREAGRTCPLFGAAFSNLRISAST